MNKSEEMKKLKNIDRKKLSIKLSKEKDMLDKNRLAVAARKEDNISIINKSKKKIARILTLLNQSTGEDNAQR